MTVRSTLTPEAWIAAATDVLVDQGIDAVRVDVLAKAMEVTRGSFYWHFKDREALLVAVLNAWRDGATEQVIRRFEGQIADPKALIGELISLPFRGRSAERAEQTASEVAGTVGDGAGSLTGADNAAAASQGDVVVELEGDHLPQSVAGLELGQATVDGHAMLQNFLDQA